MEHIELIKNYFKAWGTFDEKIFFEIFDEDVEIYNVHFPVYKGREGVKAYKDNFKSRISHGTFQMITMMTKKIDQKDVVLAEWKANVTYRIGAQVGDVIAAKSFTFELRGVNRFDIENEKITCLRIYHETTTALKLAKENS